MNNNIKFNSLLELKQRLLPAMECKVNELKISGISYIHSDDIWNYLKDNKWYKSKDLTISDCVDDILNLNMIDLKKYVKDRMNKILGGVKNDR